MGSWSLAIPTTPPFVFSSTQHCACISASGLIAFIGENRLWRTTDAGLTWTEMTPNGVSQDRAWEGISCSDDGQIVLASDTKPGRLWISTNGGNTWTETQPNGNSDQAWGVNAMSANGGVLYASLSTSAAPTGHVRLYKSTNGGTSWTDVAAAATWTYTVGPSPRLSGVRCSDDGSVIFCCEPNTGTDGGRLRISSDGGTTWTELQPLGDHAVNWGDSTTGVCIAMDSTGSKLLAANQPKAFTPGDGKIRYSTNSGSTWSDVTPLGGTNIKWLGVAMSKDTSFMLAMDNTNFIFYGSVNQGGAWTNQEMLFPFPNSADSYGSIAINRTGTFAVTDGDTGDPDYNDAVLYFRTSTTPLAAQFSDTMTMQDQSTALRARVAGPNHTLVHVKDLMEGRSGWFYDVYVPSILVHYGEEGANQHSILCGGVDGGIYQLTGNSDGGTDVPCHVLTASHDQGDTRLQKLYNDIMLDCVTGSANVVATPQFDNDAVVVAPTTVNNAVRTQVPIPIGSGSQTARNISLDLQWNMNGSRQQFYIWEPRLTEEGGKVFAFSWETCWLTHGIEGHFIHGWLYLVHISTADLTFSIINPDTSIAASVTVPNSGGNHVKTYVRLPVTKGTLFKYRVSSTAQFRIEGQESELLVKPWGITGAYSFRGSWISKAWQHERIFQDVPEGRAE